MCLSATILTLDELIRQNNDFLGGTPPWCHRSRGISSTSEKDICSQEIRDSRLSYGGNPESLSHLGLNQYWVVTLTGKQTNRIMIANMCLAICAVARNKPNVQSRSNFRVIFLTLINLLKLWIKEKPHIYTEKLPLTTKWMPKPDEKLQLNFYN